MRWTGGGSMLSEDATVLYSGGTTNSNGDGSHPQSRNSEVITRLAASQWHDLDHTSTQPWHYTKVCILQVCATTIAASENEKEDFYNLLEATLPTLPHHDMKLVIGDFNAQVGPEKEDWEVIGKEGVGTRSHNGEKSCSISVGAMKWKLHIKYYKTHF